MVIIINVIVMTYHDAEWHESLITHIDTLISKFTCSNNMKLSHPECHWSAITQCLLYKNLKFKKGVGIAIKSKETSSKLAI